MLGGLIVLVSVINYHYALTMTGQYSDMLAALKKAATAVIPTATFKGSKEKMGAIRIAAASHGPNTTKSPGHLDTKVKWPARNTSASNAAQKGLSSGNNKSGSSSSLSIPPKAVIVTKIHGDPTSIGLLKQSYCLLTTAYNSRANHDLLVFSTFPIERSDQEEIHNIVAPANVTFLLDAPPLDDLLETFTPTQKKEVERYCNVSSYRKLTWDTKCRDPSVWYPECSLSYLWQAEFRSKHLWNHPVLKQYRYLMWWDSDTLPTNHWDVDPIVAMAQNNWTLLYEKFVNKLAEEELPEFDDRVFQSFGKYLCSIESGNNNNGSMVVDMKDNLTDCYPKRKVRKVHGFFHIVDLNVYLNSRALEWYDNFIGETKFSRRWDDQLAVTIPGAMLNPQGCFTMRSKGLGLDVLHNGFGWGWGKKSIWFHRYWKEIIMPRNTTFSKIAANKCRKYIKYPD